MENTRAFFLLEKEILEPEDKEFLKKHIESLDATIRFLGSQIDEAKAETLCAKDMLDEERQDYLKQYKEIQKVVENFNTSMNTTLSNWKW